MRPSGRGAQLAHARVPTVALDDLASASPPVDTLDTLLRALGPGGPGVVLVRAAPELAGLAVRSTLARAHAAAGLGAAEQAALLREAGLGSDVGKAQPRNTWAAACQLPLPRGDGGDEHARPSVAPAGCGSAAPQLRAELDALGRLLHRVAALVAAALDAALDGSGEGAPVRPLAGSREAGAARAAPGGVLARAVHGSSASKLRLVHYYSRADTARLSDRGGGAIAASSAAAPRGVGGTPRKQPAAPTLSTPTDSMGASGGAGSPSPASGAKSALAALGSWQGWHFDYGLLTAIAPPVYHLRRSGGAAGCDGGEAAAETTMVPEAAVAALQAGLAVLLRRPWEQRPSHAGACAGGIHGVDSDGEAGPGGEEAWEPQLVHTPADCVAVQVGEAAQILSGGRLAATLHCVTRPPARGAPCAAGGAAGDEGEGAHDARNGDTDDQPGDDDVAHLSRSTAVLFLQPAWGQRMGAGGGDVDGADAVARRAAVLAASAPQCSLGLAPALATRWAPGGGGPTFAEFSKAVTAAYYGR